VPWIPLQVVLFHTGCGDSKAAWHIHGVSLLTYVLCTEEASDVLRRVALRRPDMLSPLPTGASPTATSAATSVAADAKQLALDRTALLWSSNVVYVDEL
jgi:hypothetical protein